MGLESKQVKDFFHTTGALMGSLRASNWLIGAVLWHLNLHQQRLKTSLVSGNEQFV